MSINTPMTRLRLFYYEPSELGFRLIIVMVVLIGFFLASKCKRKKSLLAVLILVDAFTLYLARSMGAIGIGALAIGVMFLYDWIARNSRKKTVIYSCICAALLLFCVMMAVTQSDLYMRLMDTLQGKDSSNRYRIGLSFRILGDSFLELLGAWLRFWKREYSRIFKPVHRLGIKNGYYKFLCILHDGDREFSES